ncbi:YdcF family protein [Paenibacillus antri]|uniref:YdcF family protein n=1 Tax=Paenibacillus antri TaxID=2582848 RepID=UPI00130536F5|nr:YdcF family protein [Paenibacillus antri]
MLIWWILMLRKRTRVHLLILFFLVSFYASTISLVSDTILGRLEQLYEPPQNIQGEAIIVLAGGATLDTLGAGGPGDPSGETANRLLAAAALYKKLDIPIIISVGKVYPDTGFEAMVSKNWLVAMGIPENKVWVENKSRNTEDNIKYVKSILDENKITEPILVTSALHMARSVQHFEEEGIEIIPYPTGYMVSKSLKLYPERFLPSYEAVNKLGHALKEYLGLLLLRI